MTADEEMQVIRGIRDFYYSTADMDRAVTFYRDVLGFSVDDVNPWWSSLSWHGVRVGLHGNEGKPVHSVPYDEHGAHGGGTLTLACDEIDGEVARLRSLGVRVLGEVSRNEWGDLVAFLDPDGNVLKLMQPPAGA